MLDVVLDTKDLSVTALITKVRAICTQAGMKTDFAPMGPFFTALLGKLTLLEQEEANLRDAENAVKAQTVLRDERHEDVKEDLATLAHDLGEHASGENVILDIGARLKNKPSQRPAPGIPQNLQLSAGDEDGELTGHCDGQPGLIDLLEIEYTETDPNLPATTWTPAAPSLRTTFDIKNLPTGKKVWVRVRAGNTTGKSPWSDPACKRVP
jgi:hypothetical protein